jgi:hypothetical protein
MQKKWTLRIRMYAWSLVVTFLLALPLIVQATYPLVAQTATATAGETTILVRQPKAITIQNPQPKFGTARVASPDGNSADYRLLFTPDPTLAGKTDNISYLVEGDSAGHSVNVEITPSQVTGSPAATGFSPDILPE